MMAMAILDDQGPGLLLYCLRAWNQNSMFPFSWVHISE